MPPRNNSTAKPQPVGMSTTKAAAISASGRMRKPTQRQKDIGSNKYTCNLISRDSHVHQTSSSALKMLNAKGISSKRCYANVRLKRRGTTLITLTTRTWAVLMTKLNLTILNAASLKTQPTMSRILQSM